MPHLSRTRQEKLVAQVPDSRVRGFRFRKWGAVDLLGLLKRRALFKNDFWYFSSAMGRVGRRFKSRTPTYQPSKLPKPGLGDGLVHERDGARFL